MEQIEVVASRLLAAAGAVLTAVFASVGAALGVLLFAQVMDAVTGVVANGRRRNLDPAAGHLGWRRKANYVLFVLTLAVVQQYAPISDLPAAQTVAGGMIGFEVMSILRNLLLSSDRGSALLAQWFRVETPPDERPQEN